MNLDPTNPEKTPTPEELAAYFDGELPAAEANATDAWLSRHPRAAADFEELRRVSTVWQDNVPPEPSPAQWDQALRGIEGRLAAPKPMPRRLPSWRLGLLAAAACAAVLLIVVGRAYWPAPKPLPADDDEPYPVASAAEIVIISMDPRNTHNLVVGLPPIHGDLILADFEDVELLNAAPNGDGQVPNMHQGGEVPLILPTGSWGGKED